MLSNQELEQTIILNLLISQRSQSVSEIQEKLVNNPFSRIDSKPPNYIKAVALSLEKRFNRFNITLFKTAAKAASVYRLTDEAIKFALDELLTPIYNEKGELESCFYQHPIVLEPNRRMLI